MTIKLSEQSQSGKKLCLNNPWNIIKTGFLVLTWIVMGMHIELVAPTMPILAANTKVDFSGMGSVLASRGAGYLAASILGAILQNIVKRHSEGLLVLAFFSVAVVVFVTPFVTSVMLMCTLFFLHGISQGFTDLGGTNILLTLWGANAAAPLNTVHLGYGIGAIFVNLLVRPFLTKNVPSISVVDIKKPNSILLSTDTLKHNSNIVIPYSIIAGLCALIAAGYVFFYIRELKNQKQKSKIQKVDVAAISRSTDSEDFSPYSPRTCGRGFFQYGLVLSIVFICSMFFIGGNDQTFSKFFFTYLNSPEFNLSTETASWGIILYWLSYSIGRLIVAIVSLFVSITTCLNIVWFGGLCLAIAWLVFLWAIGLTSTSLFILGAGTGLVFSPIVPLTFALFNQRLNVVPILLALVLCGSALGMINFQKIAGFVMDRNPNHFPTILVVCILVSICLYVISNLIYVFHQRKNPLNSQTLVINSAQHPSKCFSEEEQHMIDYLKNQENK